MTGRKGEAFDALVGYPFEPEYKQPYQQVFTTAEVAEILQVTERTVEKACVSGKLRAGQMGTRWRVTRKALDDFLDGRQS